MAGILRQNPYIGEIIEELQMHRAKYRSDAEALDHLSADENAWIDNELLTCMADTRYFLGNYYAYRDETHGFKGLYPFFDSQEILYEEYRKLEAKYGRVRAMVLKARQMGSTTYNCGEFFHKTVFSEHINGLIVAQDEGVSEYVMGMYESALDYLPWWLRPRIKVRQRGAEINFDEPDESIRMQRPGLKTWIYADNARKPTGVGRSKTINRALLTELAFWPDGKQLSKSLIPTFNTPDGFYVMESTANGRNDHWHNLWRRAEAGKVDWHPIFIPFYRRAVTYSRPIEGVFTLSADELEMREQVEQKEKYVITDETFNWMRYKKEEFASTDGDDMMFSQEYTSNAEESFQSSAVTAFPRGTINRYSKKTIEPIWMGEISYDFEKREPKLSIRPLIDDEQAPKEPEYGERFQVWERAIPKAEYVFAADVALGNPGGDFCVIQVIKKGAGIELDEQVAVWHGRCNPTKLAEFCLAIGWTYNEAMACVEVNSYGMQTNSTLMRNYEYENIYRFKRLDRLNNMMTNIVGFYSDVKSTDALMAKMSEVFMEETLRIRDKHTIDEFRDYTEQGAQGEGAHDDLVDALMIAIYCAHEGEVRERQEGKKAAPADAVVYDLLDRWGTKIMDTTSRMEVERMQKKFPGSAIQKRPGTGPSAMTMINGRKVPVPATQQNTEYSPIYDKEGSTQSKMHEAGYEPEEMLPEDVAEFESQIEEMEDSPDGWKYV